MSDKKFKVVATTGIVDFVILDNLSQKEAVHFCMKHNWEYFDDNDFCWDLDYKEA